MKLVLGLIVGAAATLTWASAASAADNRAERKELLTLYLLSVAADRCGFSMTSRQADAVDRDIKMLVQKLKLRQRDNDAIYSEADSTFERQGAAACDRNGSFAKGFRETLQRLSGP